jgi:F-type H+-transporting ATPase subunit a
MSGTLLAADIEVGHHKTVEFLGLTLNIDTVISTIVAGLIVLGAGLYMAHRASSGRPSKLQLAFETIVDAIEKQVA